MARTLLSAAILCIASIGIAPNPIVGFEQKPRVRYTSDYRSAPSTLRGLRDAVDAIVIGRVESSVVRTFGQYGRIATLHTVRVLEILKDDNGIGEVGSTFKVEQSAGELELPDKIVTVNPGVAPLSPGDTQIFFLTWHHPELHYAMAYGPQASFKIKGNSIEAKERRGVAAQFNGKSVAEFLRELRR